MNNVDAAIRRYAGLDPIVLYTALGRWNSREYCEIVKIFVTNLRLELLWYLSIIFAITVPLIRVYFYPNWILI